MVSKAINKFYLAAGVLVVLFGVNQARAATTDIEGAAGGGLVPMALMHPQGPLISYTTLDTQDYGIQSFAVGGSILDRVEISLGHMAVNAPTVGSALALDRHIHMNTLGLKVKVLDMSDSTPQVAIGLQAKNSSGAILDFLKTANAISGTSGTDLYIAATKVVTIGGKAVALNGVLRGTKANTMGVLGFGGGTVAGGKTSYSWNPEVSAGMFLTDTVIAGGEYRAKPDNISNTVGGFGIKEECAYSLFVAYLPNKNMAVTAAYINLGQVGPSQAAVPAMSNKQDGISLRMQANF